MRNVTFNRRALSVTAVAALLAGCSAAQLPMAAPNANLANAASKEKVFHYTGAQQKFVVPKSVTEVTIDAVGAAGYGINGSPSDDAGGLGGRVYAVVPVTSGEELYVFVGGKGFGTSGGFNGGGYGAGQAYGGGGASDVRDGGNGLEDRIVIAGGGGGAGVGDIYGNGYGGAGGGRTGGDGGSGGSGAPGDGGHGGSQRHGGKGGAGGKGSESKQDGRRGNFGIYGSGGMGGAGGQGPSSGYQGGGGGGGGGGYYGGGGGGGGAFTYASSSNCGGGGGGGSSYVWGSALKMRMIQGWKHAKGDGLVTISWN